MPQPTGSDIHVDTPLTQISTAEIQDSTKFVAARVFPNVPVQHRSDRYYVYDRHSWNRDEMEERAPGTESAGAGWDVDNTPSYYCPVYGIHKDIDDQDRANADPQADPDMVATRFVTQKGLIKRDRLWAQKYFNAGIWTNERAGVASGPTGSQFLRWDVAGSTPIEDIDAAKTEVEERTGFEPNVMVVSRHVFNALKNHAAILDRIKHTQRGILTAELLATLFDVEEVVIPRGIYTPQAEGATTPQSTYIVGKHALLAYRPSAPGMLIPSAGYTFSWTGYLGAGQDGNRILNMRADLKHSDRIELEMSFDQKQVGADLAMFFENAVS